MYPPLAVITPVLNEEFFLPLYLAAVTRYAAEVILLDGGSRDRSLEIIRAWARKTGKIRVIVQPQEGLPYSPDWREGERRNLLLEQVNAEWVLALDVDEFLDDSFLWCFQALVRERGMSATGGGRGTAMTHFASRRTAAGEPAVDTAASSAPVIGFPLCPFWRDPQTVRLNAPGDEHWAGCQVYRLWPRGLLRYSLAPHHCGLTLAATGEPLWEAAARGAIRLVDWPVPLYHYHYALGPRIKFNDNRRGDVNMYENRGEPDWHWRHGQYPLRTAPFRGQHPRVIKEYLASRFSRFA